jgi:NAD(P)-dependent dehydrogenase (short-subunit alcohol dehydrogenase family)
MTETNRVALVTGASRGLGEVIARVLADQGYDLVIGARDEVALGRARNRLAQHRRRVVALAGDVTDAAVRRRWIDAARELGGLDVLVNNASELGGISPLMTFDVQRFGRVFPVNTGAPIALAQLAVPLLAVRHGLIVNITSDAAHSAYAGWGPYGASKAALELLTRTLAGELLDRGVSAVLVDPGDMRTRMHQEAFPGQDISDRPLPDVTAPFWRWLFDQDREAIRAQRFVAQQQDAPWHQPASSRNSPCRQRSKRPSRRKREVCLATACASWCQTWKGMSSNTPASAISLDGSIRAICSSSTRAAR